MMFKSKSTSTRHCTGVHKKNKSNFYKMSNLNECHCQKQIFEDCHILDFLKSVQATVPVLEPKKCLDPPKKRCRLSVNERDENGQAYCDHLQLIFQRENFHIYLNTENDQLNNCVEYLRNFWNFHAHKTEAKAFEKVSGEWKRLTENTLEYSDKLLRFEEHQKEHIFERALECSIHIWGPTFKEFFNEYAQFRPNLRNDTKLRNAMLLWTILPEDLKLKFWKSNLPLTK